MNKNDFFAKPSSLAFSSICAGLLALASIYICFIDDFAHSLILLFNYILLFALVVAVAKGFEKGEKEIVKAGTAAIFTLTFIVFAETFVDIIALNNYYLFSTDYIATIIGVAAILIFLLFIIAYVGHFVINSSNSSATIKVESNRMYLIWITVLCFALAATIIYHDVVIGRRKEWFLVLTYCMHGFVCLMLISVEVLVNNFRIAREKGNLNAFAKELVGAKAAKVASGKKTVKKAPKKTSKKATKKA